MNTNNTQKNQWILLLVTFELNISIEQEISAKLICNSKQLDFKNVNLVSTCVFCFSLGIFRVCSAFSWKWFLVCGGLCWIDIKMRLAYFGTQKLKETSVELIFGCVPKNWIIKFHCQNFDNENRPVSSHPWRNQIQSRAQMVSTHNRNGTHTILIFNLSITNSIFVRISHVVATPQARLCGRKGPKARCEPQATKLERAVHLATNDTKRKKRRTRMGAKQWLCASWTQATNWLYHACSPQLIVLYRVVLAAEVRWECVVFIPRCGGNNHHDVTRQLVARMYWPRNLLVWFTKSDVGKLLHVRVPSRLPAKAGPRIAEADMLAQSRHVRAWSLYIHSVWMLANGKRNVATSLSFQKDWETYMLAQRKAQRARLEKGVRRGSIPSHAGVDLPVPRVVRHNSWSQSFRYFPMICAYLHFDNIMGQNLNVPNNEQLHPKEQSREKNMRNTHKNNMHCFVLIFFT